MTAIFSFRLLKRLRNLPTYNLLCNEETITKNHTQHKIPSYGNWACCDLSRLTKHSQFCVFLRFPFPSTVKLIETDIKLVVHKLLLNCLLYLLCW